MNDYTKYSKQPVVNDEVVEEVKEPAVETVEEEVVEPVVEEFKTVTGVVSGCAKLNVREQPNLNAKVVCVISEGSEVVIVEDETTNEEFYPVCTAAGMEGYCMKKFISVK